jgi:hypothetical protein
MQQNFVNFENNKKTKKTFNTLEEKISEVAPISKLREKIKEINHPYFDKLEKSLYTSFISDYGRLAQGEFSLKLDTKYGFLPNDMKYMNDGVHLKISSPIWNFSDNIYNEEHLLILKDMIEKKKITIKRIFLYTSEKEKEVYKNEMEKQYKIGVQVYVYTNDKFFENEDWLYEDFIIQDDKILIQQFPHSVKDGFSIGPNSKDRQLLASNSAKVSEKVNQFSLLEARAVPYGKSNVLFWKRCILCRICGT